MKKNERDILDDLIRSKLEHFETDTSPDDWEAIEKRLPKKAVIIPWRKRITYIAAAVITSLFLITGSLYISQHNQMDSTIAKQIEKETEKIESIIKQEVKAPEITPDKQTEKQPVSIASASIRTVTRSETTLYYPQEDTTVYITEEIPDKEGPVKEKKRIMEVIDIHRNYPLIIDEPEVKENPQKRKKEKSQASRKWGFGMGAGGFTESTGNVVNTYVLKSSSLEDEKLLSMNSNADLNTGKAPKTNIKHRTPVSFGLSVSRHLNDRFSLQSGIVYSMLNSDWETQASAYNNKTRQRLHFIGIPLSVSYKIAEWNRFQFYTAAGALTEVNVAGQLRVRSFVGNEHISTMTESTRMKEWQWSVNARAGVSYPVIRFLSAFAEVGAAYYFDNGSDIETIYSDKPFNVSPQIGFRLSF